MNSSSNTNADDSVDLNSLYFEASGHNRIDMLDAGMSNDDIRLLLKNDGEFFIEFFLGDELSPGFAQRNLAATY